ncbi:MAG: matrixin family metalloprotease [Sulfuricellaceae bacterium]
MGMLNSRIVAGATLILSLAAVFHPALAVSAEKPSDGKFEYVIYGMGGARWANGVMQWYYNPQGQPSGISTSDVVAALQKAAQKWENGCAMRFQYMGETTTPTYQTDKLNVVGWQSGFGASGETYTSYSDLKISEVDIRFDSGSVTKIATLEAVATHEFGHALGLDHPSQPESIMFANPYHPASSQLTLKGDDIAGCAALYGTSSLGTLTRYDTSAPLALNAGESVSLYATDYKPSSQPSSSLVSASSATASIYYSVFYRGIAVGQPLHIDVVAPDGALYESSSWDNSYVNGSYYFGHSSWAKNGASVLPGAWTVYFWSGSELKGKTQFNVSSSYAVNPPAELVLIGAPSATSSRFNYSVSNLTPSRGISAYSWSFDGGALKSGASQSVAIGSGMHSIQLAVRDSNSHYSTGGGQGDGADYLLTQSFTLPSTGTFSSAAFSAQASGVKQALSLAATMVMPVADSGKKNIYVMARVGNGWFYKTPMTWNPLQGALNTAQPLFSATAPAVLTFNILDDMDMSSLPVGTEVYIGYGDTLDELVQRANYGKIFMLN